MISSQLCALRQASKAWSVGSLIDPRLVCQVTVKIFRAVERVVGLRDVKGEHGGVEPGFVPMAKLHGFGKLLPVDADLPMEQAGGVELGLAQFAHRGFVAARQSIKREPPVLI